MRVRIRLRRSLNPSNGLPFSLEKRDCLALSACAPRATSAPSATTAIRGVRAFSPASPRCGRASPANRPQTNAGRTASLRLSGIEQQESGRDHVAARFRRRSTPPRFRRGRERDRAIVLLAASVAIEFVANVVLDQALLVGPGEKTVEFAEDEMAFCRPSPPWFRPSGEPCARRSR